MNIDTGVEGTHPAFPQDSGVMSTAMAMSTKAVRSYTTNYPTPEDDGGHGTHTMGTICAAQFPAIQSESQSTQMDSSRRNR